jgi:hypothetical protein
MTKPKQNESTEAPEQHGGSGRFLRYSLILILAGTADRKSTRLNSSHVK